MSEKNNTEPSYLEDGVRVSLHHKKLLDEISNTQKDQTKKLSDAISSSEDLLLSLGYSLPTKSSFKSPAPTKITQLASPVKSWNDILEEAKKSSSEEVSFADLLSQSEINSVLQKHSSLNHVKCDKYDYMIAGTCGLIGGLIDVFFVGMPNQGPLTKFTDDLTDRSVQKFAKFNGWKGSREGKDPTASAIGFLERKFKINYDHRHSGDVDKLFNMSARNHHIKSLGHSPDLVGLFFSILDQFTNTAHFVDNGRIISVNTETFQLNGSNFISKIFSGFVNWLGHLFSDVAGSSGTQGGRGAGIPIPFYSLLQFINIGEFGQHRQTFAKVSVQVFEQGYDFRHGLALTIPVLTTELLTRFMWVIKCRFYHKQAWNECIPSMNAPKLRLTLLIAHGSLCLVDFSDATLRSGGNIIQFMLRSNVVAWARFSTLALKEVFNNNSESVENHIHLEYRRLLL